MTVDDILKLLDSVSQYIVYVYPGYITIYVYLFFRAKSIQDSKGVILKSIAISFLYKLCLDKFNIDSEIYYHTCMIALSITVPYLAWRLQNSETVADVFDVLDIKTRFEDNEIQILDNGEKSAWVRVYLNNSDIVYEGYLGERELEEGKRQFIMLKKYKKYTLNKNGCPIKPYIEKNKYDEDKVLIFYESINRIEKRKL